MANNITFIKRTAKITALRDGSDQVIYMDNDKIYNFVKKSAGCVSPDVEVIGVFSLVHKDGTVKVQFRRGTILPKSLIKNLYSVETNI